MVWARKLVFDAKFLGYFLEQFILKLSVINVREPLKVTYTCCKQTVIAIYGDLYGMGFAIGKLVSRHMYVSLYELPLELGHVKGPLRSQAIY